MIRPNLDPAFSAEEFFQSMATPLIGEVLFDHLHDLTFFVKNVRSQYVALNQTLVQRCGLKDKSELIGRTALEMFPPPLGKHFLAQDLAVIEGGQPLLNELEQHPYPQRTTGWCLTTKLPLRDKQGRVIGLVGMSRDLQSPSQDVTVFEPIARVVEMIKRRLDQPLKTQDLAESVDLSVWQLDQRVRDLFGVTTAQLVLQLRMEAATQMLRESSLTTSQIALTVGYGDQSAFTRQFRKTIGMTPGKYRQGPERLFQKGV